MACDVEFTWFRRCARDVILTTLMQYLCDVLDVEDMQCLSVIIHHRCDADDTYAVFVWCTGCRRGAQRWFTDMMLTVKDVPVSVLVMIHRCDADDAYAIFVWCITCRRCAHRWFTEVMLTTLMQYLCDALDAEDVPVSVWVMIHRGDADDIYAVFVWYTGCRRCARGWFTEVLLTILMPYLCDGLGVEDVSVSVWVIIHRGDADSDNTYAVFSWCTWCGRCARVCVSDDSQMWCWRHLRNTCMNYRRSGEWSSVGPRVCGRVCVPVWVVHGCGLPHVPPAWQGLCRCRCAGWWVSVSLFIEGLYSYSPVSLFIYWRLIALSVSLFIEGF